MFRAHTPACTALLLAGLVTWGCGSDEPPSSGVDAGGGTKGCPKVDLGPQPTGVETVDFKVAVTVLGATETLQGRLAKPDSCTEAAPCPLVVVVQDRETDAVIDYGTPAKWLADRAGAVVATFNLPGMGVGGFKAPGKRDYGGVHDMTTVKEVMRLLRERKYVDATKTGYLTVGYGLVPTAAALKTFGPNTLKDVLFLIDVEGPVDRCAASQAPEDVQKGIGPGDGPGASDTACNLSADGPKATVYPAATDTAPGAVVCAEAAWPITKTGEDCTSDWWNTREPARDLRSVGVRYQRLQFEVDHRQPSRWSSRVAISSAAASKSCPYFGLNDMPPCQSPLSDSQCAGLSGGKSCWLQGNWGHGLGPAPYAGDGTCEASLETVFATVLPGYVKRMLDTSAYPNCK